MSKVKIQGHSSGSGSVTITAPNTHSHRTLTIPDITGTALTSADTGTVTQTIVHPDAVNRFISGRKNLIINGGMNVWQRGTSGSGLDGYFSADRWKITYNTGGINTMTTERVVNTNPNTSSVYALHIHSGGVVTPTNSFERLQTRFEYDTTVMSDGSYRDVTLSFWAKSPNSNIINVRAGNSAGGSYDTNLTTSWQKFAYTFSRNIDEINFYFYDGSVPDIQLAEVQLEIGDQATDFEHRSYGEELALCQRFYQKHSLAQRYIFYYTSPWSNSNGVIDLPVEMRIAPTIAYGFTAVTNAQPGGGGVGGNIAPNGGTPHTNYVSLRMDSWAGYQNWAPSVVSGGNAENAVYLDAEL